MTDRNDDVWDQAEGRDPEDARDGDHESPMQDGFDSAAPGADGDGVVDAQVTEVPARPKKKMLPVILGIGLIAFGGMGFVGYSFYKSMFPSKSVEQMSSDGILAEQAVAVSPATQSSGLIGAEPAPGQMAPGLIPADGVSSAAADQPGAAAGAEQVPPSAALPVAPEVTPAPVAAAALAAPAAPPVLPEKKLEAPVAVPAQAKPAEPAKSALADVVERPVNCAIACPQSVKQEEKPKAARKAAKATAVAKAPSERIVSVKKANKSRKDAKKQAKTSEVAKSDESVELNKISGYTILAFEPKTGEHQQAWLRNKDGKVIIVRKGDALDGAVVYDVSFQAGAVMTTRGDIRK